MFLGETHRVVCGDETSSEEFVGVATEELFKVNVRTGGRSEDFVLVVVVFLLLVVDVHELFVDLTDLLYYFVGFLFERVKGGESLSEDIGLSDFEHFL